MQWAVKAKTSRAGGEDVFCLTLKMASVAKPAPDCNSGTLLALQFFSDQAEAHALATVGEAPVSARPKSQTSVMVTGIAAADVDRVRIRYAGHTYPAAMTAAAADVPVDKNLAKELTGATPAEIRRLPTNVTVRAFAVSIPPQSGNPPTEQPRKRSRPSTAS